MYNLPGVPRIAYVRARARVRPVFNNVVLLNRELSFITPTTTIFNLSRRQQRTRVNRVYRTLHHFSE